MLKNGSGVKVSSMPAGNERDELAAARLHIFALQDGAMRAQALAYSLRSGLFEQLAESPATPEELRLAPRVAPTLLCLPFEPGTGAQRDEQGAFPTLPLFQMPFWSSPVPVLWADGSLLFHGRHEQIGRLGEVLATGNPLPEAGVADSFDIFSGGRPALVRRRDAGERGPPARRTSYGSSTSRSFSGCLMSVAAAEVTPWPCWRRIPCSMPQYSTLSPYVRWRRVA